VLRLRALSIDTYRDYVAYMHRDCHVCRAEGFAALTRVEVQLGERRIVATLHVFGDGPLGVDDVALSTAAWRALEAVDGAPVSVRHAPSLPSLSLLRRKIYGHALADDDWRAIVGDIAAGRYSDLHLVAFVTACIGDRVSPAEGVALTRAMVDVGERLTWPARPVLDKHSVGGLPGNRTTPIVVAIVAAAGLTIPKTSSRAITSPAGTADAVETLTPVDLDLAAMRRVVEREGGCLVWGGRVRLSPADDVLIRVERPLDLDSDAQLVASVLSKKLAAGSTHVLIDMPVGPTAKVRSESAAHALASRLIETGAALGLAVEVEFGDGRQPIGRGIGPALEARDVLAVLQGAAAAPRDLRARALVLAGRLLEAGGATTAGEGAARAARVRCRMAQVRRDLRSAGGAARAAAGRAEARRRGDARRPCRDTGQSASGASREARRCTRPARGRR
jgi:thymidine phosphorylase